MGNVVAALNEFKGELRARPVGVEQARHDPGDLEVLAAHVATVTNKANEVDGLRMQLELVKNRIKRFEEQSSPAAYLQRPGTSSTHRELYEATPAPHTHQHPIPQHPLPAIRTASVEQLSGMHAPRVPFSQGIANFQPSGSSYVRSNDVTSLDSGVSNFRPSEPPPSHSSFSGWRPAESQQRTPLSSQPHPHPPEASNWTTVNTSHPIKRPFEKQESSSAPGSPKRPRLAPIMPRSTYSDESFVPTASSMSHSATIGTPDGSLQHRVGAPSEPTQSQGLPTPASANTNSYRFITSTAQADSQALWGPEHERMQQAQQAPGPLVPPARSKGRGRGGRARGKGSRGGNEHLYDRQQEVEMSGTPDWEKPDWTGGQIPPDGYYNPLHPQRGGLVRRSGGTAGGPSEREQEYPSTPVHGENDPFGVQLDEASANKKSRTKPIRNAEGVLIRKDGRPDMRSVSSANNLRRVHQKKEAERAEIEGRTPTSARSIAPAHSNSSSEEGEGHEDMRSGTPDFAAVEGHQQDTQERHGIDIHGRNNYSAPPEGQPTPVTRVMKTEQVDDDDREGSESIAENSQTVDVVMREMSPAQEADLAVDLQQRQESHNADLEPKSEEGPTAA
ncbi:hypothetical protein LTR08_008649 [Meristemomyces frigidus]|nr:hypothetical protein LTR08_008649 [Meristemomyces frigidus]